MYNPRAACGPVEGFVRPSKRVIVVYVPYNDELTTLRAGVRYIRALKSA